MRSAPTTRRQRAQRARRDAEREQRQGPPFIPHGTPIGRITVELHGQTVIAEILQAGERCRTYGVSIDGDPPVLMGLYEAGAKTTARIARLPSKRSDIWDA